ncbi:DUF3558 domain-containing protein [Amycolatopsis sp. DSM 110486]|nr:DUF3558 domain-containing protein [Amycolatopsis sp. DSM 110486]
MTLSAAAAVLTVAAGCSTASPSTPASTAPSATTAALPHDGAPRVEHPLPASVLSGDPCQDALTPDQLNRILTITPQGARDDSAGLGPACNWHNSTSGAAVGVSFVTQTHQGLSGVYENTQRQVKRWQVLPPVQGFPAVAYSTESAGNTSSFCEVSTGIRDDLSFDTSLYLSSAKIGTKDPCDVAAQVVDMIVTNLRQKAGA